MTVKKEKIKEFIGNNPNLSANETLKELQKRGLGIRKTNFLEIFRNEKKLPEPTKIKREASIPIKYKKAKLTKKKPVKRKPKLTVNKKLSIKKKAFKIYDYYKKEFNKEPHIVNRDLQTGRLTTDQEFEIMDALDSNTIGIAISTLISFKKDYLESKIKIPYEKTKFGKIAKRMEKTHGISEQKAIERARALLKIPRKDYIKLNRKDVIIILSESP